MIEEYFRLKGEEAVVIVTTQNGPLSPYYLGKRAAEEGVDTVVGVGGDGTFNHIVSGMMNSGVPTNSLPRLGFIGLGTGNNFVKNIGIAHKSFGESMSTILNGRNSCIDLGLMEDLDQGRKKYFLNVLSFGFDAKVVSRTSKSRKSFLPKSLSYLKAAGQEIASGFTSYEVELVGTDFIMRREVCLLAVLNGPTYGAIFRIAPGAKMSDGLFDVCLVDKVSKIRALYILRRAIQGEHVALPEVNMLRVSSLTISSVDSKPIPREIDGEVISDGGRCRISVIPKVLKVLTPIVLVTESLAGTSILEYQLD
jgi:YegS/Rv2252/BmrU family lipid kinase